MSSTNAYCKKRSCKKETVHKCLWQKTKQKRKKERTEHKCLWQRKKDQTTNVGGKGKMAALIRQANSWRQMKERPNHKSWWQTKRGCPNQASKQLTPNERNITDETTSKTTKRWPTVTCKHNVEKTSPNHNSLIDYCLQQMSGRLQSKP